MKRLFSIIIVVFLLTMSFGFFNSVFAQGGFDVGFDVFGEIGDYVELKMTGENEEMEMTGYIRGEITHEKTITVKGKNYDCLVMTMKGSGDIESFIGIKGTWTVTGKMWGDKVTENVVKETSNMKMTMEYQGEILKMTTESTTIPISETSTWTSKNNPGLGDTWKETTIEEITTTEISETPEGKESDTNTETISTVTQYEYLKDETLTTKLGTFECRVIKSYDEEDSYYSDFDYDLKYNDKTKKIPIKYETYEDDSLVNENEVIAYSFGEQKIGNEVIGSIGNKEDEEDTGLFGLGKVAGIDVFILIIAIIILLIILIITGVALKRHKKFKAQTASLYASDSMHRGSPSAGQPSYQDREPDTYQHQQPQYQYPSHSPPPAPQYQYQGSAYQQPRPPSQISPPPSAAPSPPRYTCQTCGEPLEYVDQYDRWYCDYCRRYQ